MLRVQRVYSHEITPELHSLIIQHCASTQAELDANLLSKYYSWSKLALWLSTDAALHYMYILYDDAIPLGLMCFSESNPVHLDVRCVVENLLFIRRDSRSLKHLLYLVKHTVQLLRKEFNSTFLVIVGNTLGPPTLPELYKRIGFSQVGTHLVLELEPLQGYT